jgi:hypothetical protein
MNLTLPAGAPPLSLYDKALFALSEVHRVDEAKHLRDRWAAIRQYAREAKNTELLRYAVEIRLRAERRLGELLGSAPKAVAGEHGGRSKIDGSRSQPSNPAPTLESMGINKTQSSKWQGLAALPTPQFEIRVAHAVARVDGMTTSAPSYSRGGAYSGENEWFTPPPFIEAAREVLGAIDLDPASHILALGWIRAEVFYTLADNGLDRPWAGRVWLNPPYAAGMVVKFLDKLLEELARGNVTQAILLTHGCTDTGRFHTAACTSQSLCFARGRIAFVAPSGDKVQSQEHGHVFYYFGPHAESFERVFGAIGLIVSVSAPPRTGST